jgi:putative transcriptional regulator
MIAPENLTQAQMIERGLREAQAYKRGERAGCRVHIYELIVPDVSALRKELELSQRDFAIEFGFPVSAVRDWERGKRFPENAALILLTLIAKDVSLVRVAMRETVRHVSTEQF